MPLFLVDGHALAYRSHYAFARNPLMNSKGQETSAVYGFLNTLLTLFNRYHPDHLAVAFDATGPTFRHEQFDDYKANRKEMPEELKAQLPVIMEMLETMGIPHFSMKGFEADDIVASMVHKWSENTEIDIVSGDKDLFQLITDRVHVIRPGRGNVLEEELDPEGLHETIGLRPDQVVDYLALVGDSSDNVPGVRGVGEKTAKQLLSQFGTLDGIYQHIDDVKSKSVRNKLEQGRDSALLSRELVTLRRDVPIETSLDDLSFSDFRTDEFKELIEELEFNRLARQLFDRGTPPRRRPPEPDPDLPPLEATDEPEAPHPGQHASYQLVDTEEGLEKLTGRIAAMAEIAVDTETSGLDPMRATLAGVAVATEPANAYYIPVTSEIATDEPGLFAASRAPGLALDVVQKHLGPVLAADRPAKIGQNIKYDALVLARAGMPLGGVTFDTMIASYCLDPARRSHGLDALAKEFFNHEMIPFSALFSTRSREKDIRTIALDRVVPYACEDADYTLRLRRELGKLLDVSQVKSLFEDVEMPLRDVLERMELDGVRVDVEMLETMSADYASRIESLEERVYESIGEHFNINSTQKLRDVLFNKLKLSPKRKTKTGFSTDVDVLNTLVGEHEVIEWLLEYRQLVKLKSTYIDALPRLVHPDTGRVHTSYNQTVAITGRLSSSEPNLQNIPIRNAEGREIRKAFIAGDDDRVLLDADYSQIELRILAHLSGDAELIQAFIDDADVHRRTAAKIMGVTPDEVSDDMRSRAKTVNFGIVYGMGARGLARSLEIGVDEAQQFIDDYFRLYPGVKRFIDDTISKARHDEAIGTVLGRVRRLPDINSSNGRARSFSERIAVNTPVQGTAADIIKLAMLEVDREIARRGLGSRMILQVHDELLFDVVRSELDEMRSLVRECMESALALAVPLKVDMGTGGNWFEAH